jgi:hypothetical protein
VRGSGRGEAESEAEAETETESETNAGQLTAFARWAVDLRA